MSILSEAQYEYQPEDVVFTGEPEELELLPATLDQALFDGLIDDDLYHILCCAKEDPICPDCSLPFIPSTLDLLEGRAHDVAARYDFIEYPLSVAVVNPARPNDPYRISRVAGMPTCSCKAFKHSKENVCKHLLALCIRGIDIPEVPAKVWEPAASIAGPAEWVRPVEVLPSVEVLARMGWDGSADGW